MTAYETLNSCYVLLHIAPGPAEPTAGHSLIVTESKKQFTLNEEVWIERLDEQLAKDVQKACEPPNLNISKVSVDRHLYAFVRKVPKIEGTSYQGMTDLFTLVALSRLINPTSTADRYSAKVFQFGVGSSPIQAIQWIGMSPDVFLGSSKRDWLSSQDGEFLKKLLAWVSGTKKMHSRIHRAYWFHEYAMRSYYLDVRWTIAVSGLEALISIGDRGMRRQFVGRLTPLAQELGINLQEDELDRAYTLRSKLSHAEGFLYKLETILPISDQRVLYEKMESLLRAVLSRSLVDESFGDFFSDDKTIAGRWPV